MIAVNYFSGKEGMREMRRIIWVMALVVCLSVVLAGCGKKNAGTVVKDLDQVVSKMESYQGSGKMIIQTGQEPQEYQVEVWYKNPNYYRISLTNAKKDISQIVLRNDEGVFVLTPHLNKSFRFQSDWPNNQGQVYLYQSLVQSIIADKDRQFTTDSGAYVFDVTANYQNASNLSRQRIWLNKKSYAPQHVEVSDANANVRVIVDFTKFEFGTKFDKDSFDMKRNLTTSNMSTMPTAGQDDTQKVQTGNTDNSKTDVNKVDKSSAGSSEKQPAAKQALGMIEPSYIPQGVKIQETTQIKIGGENAVLSRYTGTYHYSLVESQPQSQEASALSGDIIDLGYTLAVLTGVDKKTLEWTYEGIEFKLATDDLPQDEMIKVAMAVLGQSSK
jgi:outer membrane lipoprotein-sorting protein